ncbi:MAG: hypothetical protein O2890_13950 [Cyanobacteria bacterium]|nr:hypothetical protein [Cyanobacteriota bacterium]MDA0867482.1 hypothetical protein [Cyanobacteriota bacterium]
MQTLFRNPLVGIVVPGLLLVIGMVSAATDSSRQERQDLARNTAQTQVKQKLEADQQQALDRLAISRYQGTCTYVSGVQLSLELTLVGEGNQPLPEGTAVCDAYGTTAVVKDGVTADLAKTANQDVIRTFLGW